MSSSSQRPYLHPSQRALRIHQIGHSNHKNVYNQRVLDGNWIEEQAKTISGASNSELPPLSTKTEQRERYSKVADVLYHRGLGMCAAPPRGSYAEAVELTSVAHNNMHLPPRTEPTQRELIFTHPMPLSTNSDGNRAYSNKASAFGNGSAAQQTSPVKLFYSFRTPLQWRKGAAQEAIEQANSVSEKVLQGTWGSPPSGVRAVHATLANENAQTCTIRMHIDERSPSTMFAPTSSEYGKWYPEEHVDTPLHCRHHTLQRTLESIPPPSVAKQSNMASNFVARKPLRLVHRIPSQCAFDGAAFQRQQRVQELHKKWAAERDVFGQQFQTTKNVTIDKAYDAVPMNHPLNGESDGAAISFARSSKFARANTSPQPYLR